MFRTYILKRILYGVLMYVVMVFVYSALFNNVADKTLRSQIDEQLNQEVRLQRNVTEDQLRTVPRAAPRGQDPPVPPQ